MRTSETDEDTEGTVASWVTTWCILKTAEVLLNGGFVSGNVAGEHQGAMHRGRFEREDGVGRRNLLDFRQKVGEEGLDGVGRSVVGRAEDVDANAGVEHRLRDIAGRFRDHTEGELAVHRSRWGDGNAVWATMVDGRHHSDRRTKVRRN